MMNSPTSETCASNRKESLGKKRTSNVSSSIAIDSEGDGFLKTVSEFINRKDILHIINAQRRMLSRFEKTNEVLTNCNALASSRFEFVSKDFRTYRHQLSEMKKDLDYIHRTLRLIKGKLAIKYPTEFGRARKEHVIDDDDSEEEEKEKQSTIGQTMDRINIDSECSDIISRKAEECVEAVEEEIPDDSSENNEIDNFSQTTAQPVVQEALES